MAGLVYSVDSSALIHAHRRIYRPKNFGFVWKGFDKLINEGRFKASIEVYNELQKKDDEVFEWAKERKEAMFVEIDGPTQNIVSQIMAAHPRLVDTTKGRSGADPFVIALAKTLNPQMCVITEEYPGKERIPDVCDAQNVDHCGVADLVEKEGWTS
jgi:hypothetical protein